MEETKSKFRERGDPGWGPAVFAQDMRPGSQLGAFLRWRELRLREKQRACQASTTSRFYSWRRSVLDGSWILFWTDLVSRAKLSPPWGGLCLLLLSSPHLVWYGHTGMPSERGLPTPEQSASGSYELPTSGSVWGCSPSASLCTLA